ncbi:MAG: hypothetical protein AB1782_16690 [Cyanobacteriota bacterium]
MRKITGSNLIEYAIPIALVGLVVGLGLYYLFSSGLLNKFIFSTGKADIDDQSQKISLNKNLDETALPLVNDQNSSEPDLMAGDLGGTPDKPVKKCNSSTCTIDFGSFILSGIPQNYQDFTESSGSSGGTDELLSLLDQIISQIESQDPTIDVNLLKLLSNKGHAIADNQKTIETTASNLLNNSSINEIENALTSLRSQIDTLSSEEFEQILSQVNQAYNNPKNETESNIISIVNMLSDEIISVNSSLKTQSNSVVNWNTNYINGYKATYNTDTIDETTITSVTDNANSKIVSPNYSTITDLDSAIICTTGHGSDTGVQCN